MLFRKSTCKLAYESCQPICHGPNVHILKKSSAHTDTQKHRCTPSASVFERCPACLSAVRFLALVLKLSCSVIPDTRILALCSSKLVGPRDLGVSHVLRSKMAGSWVQRNRSVPPKTRATSFYGNTRSVTLENAWGASTFVSNEASSCSGPLRKKALLALRNMMPRFAKMSSFKKAGEDYT